MALLRLILPRSASLMLAASTQDDLLGNRRSLAARRARARVGRYNELGEMAGNHMSFPEVPQRRLGGGVGADCGAALVLVERAARGETATAHRLLEVEHAPGALLALGVLLVGKAGPQDARVGMARLMRNGFGQTHLDDA